MLAGKRFFSCRVALSRWTRLSIHTR